MPSLHGSPRPGRLSDDAGTAEKETSILATLDNEALMATPLPDDDRLPTPWKPRGLGRKSRLRLMGAHALERAMDARCGSMAAHCARTAHLATEVAREIGWSQKAIWDMHYAALLHEVGMLSMPDVVLFRPDDLGDEEEALFRTHPGEGANIVHRWLTNQQCSWIRGHHEAWDGSGYPDGLAGDQMNEGMCLLSLVDAWEERLTPWLLRDLRGSGKILDFAAARDLCRQGRGTLFRPDLVDALEAVISRREAESQPG